MFDFERYEAKLRERLKTSHGRFWHRLDGWKDHVNRHIWRTTRAGSPERIKAFENYKQAVFKVHLVHHFWWFVHNVICHPLIGICPIKPFFEFHDFTSRKINPPEEEDEE